MARMTNFSSSFPSGATGVAFLVLRLALASRLVTEGVPIVWSANVRGPGPVSLGILLLLCGFFVVTGFLTRAVQIVVSAIVLGVIGYRLLVVQDPVSIDHWQIWTFELATAASLVLSGPGWYSIDARLFGRREILFDATTNR